MTFTNTGRSGLALLMTGANIFPDVISIGSGSGAVAVTNTNLIAETQSFAFTTTDSSVAQTITWTIDGGAAQMSGTNLREFGLKKSGLSNTVWNREGFTTINFDGTNEVQIQVSVQIN